MVKLNTQISFVSGFHQDSENLVSNSLTTVLRRDPNSTEYEPFIF